MQNKDETEPQKWNEVNNNSQFYQRRREEYTRILIWTAGFYMVAGLLHYWLAAIPDLKTEQEDVRLFFKRGDSYDTDWLSIANFVTYTSMNALGFVYVNKVNLQVRYSVFRTLNQDNWDLFMTIFILSPIVYWSSVLMTWRSRHAIDQHVCNHWIHRYYTDCQSYDDWEVFKFNYFVWTTAFFCGMQYTYLDRGAF